LSEPNMGWINETQRGYMEQPWAPGKAKYYMWDFDPSAPLTCNGTN